MADELRQELLSKARGIGATPKKVLINEGIERWLPMVMGVAGPPSPKYPPFKVPPMPTGKQLWDDVVGQITNLAEAREAFKAHGINPITSMKEAGEDSAARYYGRTLLDPLIGEYVRDPRQIPLKSNAYPSLVNHMEANPGDELNQGFQDLLRRLAD